MTPDEALAIIKNVDKKLDNILGVVKTTKTLKGVLGLKEYNLLFRITLDNVSKAKKLLEPFLQ